MITLPAELYDRLEALAAEWGGIGHTRFHHWTNRAVPEFARKRWLVPELLERSAPCCIYGFASCLGAADAQTKKPKGYKRPPDQLDAAGLTIALNDSVFSSAERQDDHFRLPWAEWTKRLGVRRGI